MLFDAQHVAEGLVPLHFVLGTSTKGYVIIFAEYLEPKDSSQCKGKWGDEIWSQNQDLHRAESAKGTCQSAARKMDIFLLIPVSQDMRQKPLMHHSYTSNLHLNKALQEPIQFTHNWIFTPTISSRNSNN